MGDEAGVYRTYARNDLIRNRAINVALTAVLVLCAFLMATGAMMTERLASSVSQLFADAKPPHFLQMHKGDYDVRALEDFADQHPEIESWFVERMVGIDGAQLGWERHGAENGDFSSSLVDILFVTQSPEFDLLLDGDGEPVRPPAGQVHLSVAFEREFSLQPGDHISIPLGAEHLTLEVAGSVRDAQMASSLSSATRFVISEQDFDTLVSAGVGEPEIIVEYLLREGADIGSFQRAFERDESLPHNGQAVTYTMIRLVNIISDGLVAGALIFVSGLLILIALLNLRFVIRGSIEDDVREIGALKALGIPDRDISRLYLNRYRWMTLGACIVGGLLAIGATSLLTRQIAADYAAAGTSAWRFLVPLAALLLVYLIVVGTCRSILRRIRRIDVVPALVQGSVLNERQIRRRARRQARRAHRSQFAGASFLNARLAIADLRSERAQWVMVPLIFTLATIVVAVPISLLLTFQSPAFITYLGAPQADLRTDVQWSPQIDDAYTNILAGLQSDDRITNVRPFANTLFEVEGEEGWETFRVQVGEHAAGDIQFLNGRSPGAGEIAVSVLNADKFDLAVGDRLVLRTGDDEVQLRVSGVYADVTSGGYTAKMQGAATTGAASFAIYSDTTGNIDAALVATDLDQRFAGTNSLPMQDYVDQTLGYVTDALRTAGVIAFAFAVGVAVLVSFLFLRLRLTRDRSKMGVLHALGFSNRDVGKQVLLKIAVCAVLGTLVGVLLTATIGERLVGGMLSAAGLGLRQISFMDNVVFAYVAAPVCLVVAGCLGALVLVRRLEGADKSGWLRED